MTCSDPHCDFGGSESGGPCSAMRAAGLVSLGGGRGTALGTAGEVGTTMEAVLLALSATRARRPCRISARYMRVGYVLESGSGLGRQNGAGLRAQVLRLWRGVRTSAGVRGTENAACVLASAWSRCALTSYSSPNTWGSDSDFRSCGWKLVVDTWRPLLHYLSRLASR